MMQFRKTVATSLLVAAMILAGCSNDSLSGTNESNGSTTGSNNSQPAVSTTETSTGGIPVTGATAGSTEAATAAAGTTTTAGSPTEALPAQSATGPAASGGALPAPSGELVALQTTFEQIYNQVNPSVVYIEVVENSSSSSAFGNGNGNAGPAIAAGSGFVWDDQGHIVTNNHVVSGASTVTVTFADGNSVSAKVVGQDPNADLAVVQVQVDKSMLHPVTMGDSTKVKVGQVVLAIGNPFALAGSMSEGIISALARSLPVESSSQNGNGQNGQTGQSGPVYNIPDIIQTDAAINPGNSGGVLVDLQGQVLGVTAAIESNSNSSSGVGFVIPSAIVQKVVPSLISSGKYDHPWLGITGMTLTPDVATAMNLPANQRGALVIDVAQGGPAEAAGLKPSNSSGTVNNVQIPVGGDVIVAVNGQPVKQFDDLGSYLFLNTKPGDTVTLTVLRGGKQQDVKVTLGTLPTQ